MRENRTQRTDDDDIVPLLDVGERVDRDPCTKPRESHACSLDMTECLGLATQRGQWDLYKSKSNEKQIGQKREFGLCTGTTPRIEKELGVLTLQTFRRR